MNQPGITPKRWHFQVLTLGLTLVGFALRLERLDFQPLWGDEGWSFYFAALSLPDLLVQTALDIHPPLYYLLLKGWLLAAGGGPEAARFLSVGAGTLLLPLIYVSGSRLSDRMLGAASVAVAAVAPFAIYYDQEVRMYSLVTLLGLASIYFFHRSLAGQRRALTGYIGVTVAALYTMYFAVFIPLLQGVYLLLRLRTSAFKHRLARGMMVVAVLYLPWVLFAGFRLVGYVGDKRLLEGYAPLDPLAFLAHHLVAFSLGHLSEALLPFAWTSLAFVAVAALGFVRQRGRAGGLLLLYLLVPLLGGWLINLFYPFSPRFFERTLMLAAPAWWLLVAAGLVWVWRRQYLLLATLASLLLLLNLVSLQEFYALPRYPDEDYRPLLAEIGALSSRQETVLASYEWQLGLYYAYLPEPRPQLYPVPGWGQAWADDPDLMRRDLAGILARSPRIWFPAYQRLGHIWEDEAEATLAELAYPAALDWFGTATTKVTLAGAARAWQQVSSEPLNFGNRVVALDVRLGRGPYAAGRGIIPVDVTWQKLANLGSDHRINLRLVDASGRTWSSRDAHPLTGRVHLVDLQPGEILADRHGLQVLAGTPPGRYQLTLSLPQDDETGTPLDLLDATGQPLGSEAVLGPIEVVLPDPPLLAASLPLPGRSTATFEQRIRLLGYDLAPIKFKPGDTVAIDLYWQSLLDETVELVVFAQLQDPAGRPQALAERPPVYPTDRWTEGLLLRDPVDILLPATIPAGTYDLAIGWLEPDKRRVSTDRGQNQVVLQTVVVEARPHVFEPPLVQYPLLARFGQQIYLVGYDLSETKAGPGGTLTLTLYWHPTETFQRSWKVFTHLLDDSDRLAGQRDQIPGAGEFPTTAWLPGEFITDSRQIRIDPQASSGRYLLEVGLYDPVTFERLPVSTVAGEPLGDRLLLDLTPVEVK